MTTDWPILLLAFATALVAGAINSIAGGGTLLSFPMLIWAGIDPKTANATSTIGLWPGSLSAGWGYRHHLIESGLFFWPFFLASLVGGVVGSIIFLYTDAKQFEAIVPWLILLATLLFASQAFVKRITQAKHHTHLINQRWPIVALVQFLVGIYGGYFGAGMGIMMLAILAFLGLSHIHLMNGVKNIAATVINGVTIIIFIYANRSSPERLQIDWPIAAAMVLGSCIGGYACAGWAKKIDPSKVRWVVIAIGLFGAIGTAYKVWFVSP
jgi:uncharacterized membrane protein YfcA